MSWRGPDDSSAQLFETKGSPMWPSLRLFLDDENLLYRTQVVAPALRVVFFEALRPLHPLEALPHEIGQCYTL